MEEITINFGLIASEKFPDVARSRVLANPKSGGVYPAAHAVIKALKGIGCTVISVSLKRSSTEPTLVAVLDYPVSAEKADCSPPSVLQYSKYMRLYEVACWAAQDCVAVLEADGTGVLVGANCSDWGVFDRTKFITILGE